jgi:hypothetical protein
MWGNRKSHQFRRLELGVALLFRYNLLSMSEEQFWSSTPKKLTALLKSIKSKWN